MQSYYGTQLSEHISRTPEGFLIAHDVPLCRTAERVPMLYRGSEVGLPSDDMVRVYRSAADVLSKKHLASIEAKPVVAGHPGQFVNADNASWAAKGHVQNVRPGGVLPDGEQSVIGDIVITDSVLAEQVVSGQLREVSLGYSCEYTPRGDGTFSQKKLRANHIAVVESGRCGSACRINDSSAVLVGDFTKLVRRKNSWDELAKILEIGENMADEELTTEERDAMMSRILACLEKLGAKLDEDDCEHGAQDDSPESRALQHLRAVKPAIQASGDRKAIDAFNNAVRALKRQARNRTAAVVSDASPRALDDQCRTMFGIGTVDMARRLAENETNPARSFEDMARRAGARMRGEKVETQPARRTQDGGAESFETLIARRRRELLGRD